MSEGPVEAKRCPLCGEDNDCGVARGAGTCWCFSAQVPDEVRQRVPPSLQDRACVCERCASGRSSGTEAPILVDRSRGGR